MTSNDSISTSSSHSPRTIRGDHVLLRIGSLRLLLPQEEVGAAVHVEQHAEEGSATSRSNLGFISLDEELRPLPMLPADRFIAVTIGNHEDVAWCWDGIELLPNMEIQVRELPAALRAPYTPVEAFAVVKGEIVFLCHSERLRRYALNEG
jgi:hypothetical protein